jgi:hypothetical protein
LQDDIPIDDDDDDDIISDNYDNLDKTDKMIIHAPSPPLDEPRAAAEVEEDHVISMDHSDDIDESGKPEFVLPTDEKSPDDVLHMQDEVEDEEDMDELEDQYEDVIDDEFDDMEEMEAMDPEELE